MRTKALLSVAAIAASAITAMAQSNVYSLNIVGYATVSALPGYNLMANPLSAGQTNGANEIGLQINGSQILTWNGSGFNSVSYIPAFNPPPGNGWVDDNLNPAAPPSLPPGKGFFFKNTANTNVPITFVGQVVPGPSSSNTLALVQNYSLIGSPLPAGQTNITSAPVSFPAINGNTILTWNNATSSYVSALYNPAFNPPPGSGWVDVNLNPINAPGYSIGQGFFYQNLGAQASWTQSLP